MREIGIIIAAVGVAVSTLVVATVASASTKEGIDHDKEVAQAFRQIDASGRYSVKCWHQIREDLLLQYGATVADSVIRNGRAYTVAKARGYLKQLEGVCE